MPVSKDLSKEILENILKDTTLEEVIKRLTTHPVSEKPLPPRISRETSLSSEDLLKRLSTLEKQGIVFHYLNGKKKIDDPSLFQGNIENYIGLAQVPIGVIGPLRINGINANGDFYVPMATTEGALVASHNRGSRVISLSGGARVICLTERVSRAPGFLFNNLIEAGTFLLWSSKQFETYCKIAKTTTQHGKLEDVRATLEGNHVYLNFEYTTGDASGQNMVTIATDAICRYIVKESPTKPRKWFIESNMSGDKKATAMSYLFVRGKKVTAEVVIPRKICTKLLHTTPEEIMEYAKMSIVGAVQTGSIGAQGHYANALAALFLACGQDVACVSEAAIGITRIDIADKGDLYFSVSLPNIIVGTVGGGTGLPTQKECLTMLGCTGEGTARKFAEICTATVLAGEISITGALTSGEFTMAHQKYGRKG
jgi:hydroxymethylglutaryl-CoA reductase (NADPH)